MKSRILIIFLLSAVVTLFINCQSNSQRESEMQMKVDMLEELNKQLEEKNRYDQTPEGKAKLDQQAKDLAKEEQKIKCESIWKGNNAGYENKIMGITLFSVSFSCKNGTVYETVIVPSDPNEKNRKKVNPWTISKIKNECGDNWRKFGNPCAN